MCSAIGSEKEKLKAKTKQKRIRNQFEVDVFVFFFFFVFYCCFVEIKFDTKKVGNTDRQAILTSSWFC
jgi:hypothetical protein